MNTFSLRYFPLIISASIALAGCNAKGPADAESNSSNAQIANASSAKYQEYLTQISQVSMVGIYTEQVKIADKSYPFVTRSDLAENTRYISGLEAKIKADTSLSDTDKSKLLTELKSPKNNDFLGTIKQVNYPIVQATYNHLAVYGQDGIKETMASIIKIAGTENYIKLASDKENFAQNARDIFLPLGAKAEGGGIQ